MEFNFNNGYALIIGIANYPNFRKLPNIVLKDAEDIHDMLLSPKNCGYHQDNIRLLLDEKATAKGIREGLHWLAKSAKHNDTAVIFFSGHGGRVESVPENVNYLIPYDSDPTYLSKTSIDGRELTVLLHSLKVQKMIIFFDCCYSAGIGEVKGLAAGNPDFKSGLDESYYEQLSTGNRKSDNVFISFR